MAAGEASKFISGKRIKPTAGMYTVVNILKGVVLDQRLLGLTHMQPELFNLLRCIFLLKILIFLKLVREISFVVATN